jgi:hypothetical protein
MTEGIERTGKLAISGRHVTYFVISCKSLKEAKTALPDLTRAQYDAIQGGRAAIYGDTNSGLDLRSIPQADETD